MGGSGKKNRKSNTKMLPGGIEKEFSGTANVWEAKLTSNIINFSAEKAYSQKFNLPDVGLEM